MQRLIFSALVTASCTFGAPKAGLTAILEIDPPAPYDACDALISGQINPGDAERISGYLANAPAHVHSVCLDSEGGSFQEGIALAEYFWGRHATLIPAGAVCSSACALAFLGGGTLGESNVFPHRSLHPEAELGFHAPRLLLRDTSQYSATEVSEAYQLALGSISRPFISDVPYSYFVIAQITATPPDQMSLITTLEDAELAGVHILFDDVARLPFDEIGRRICNSANGQDDEDGISYPRHDRMGVISGSRVTRVERTRANGFLVSGRVGYVMTEEPWTCDFEYSIGEQYAWGGSGFWGQVTNEQGGTIPVTNLNSFPKAFRIADLSRGAVHDATSLQREFLRYD